MRRSVSPPVHLHVGKKTPVHLHIKPAKKGLTKSEKQQLSCSEMSAGRPSVRNSGSFSASQGSRTGHWLSPSSRNPSPWVPPPGRSRKAKMAWEGTSHRLEIHPEPSGTTVLHLSDLSGDDESSVSDKRNYDHKVETLRAEMDHLKAEVDLHKSIRELEEKESARNNTELKMKEAQLSYCEDELRQSQVENAVLKRSLSRSRSCSPNRPRSAMEAEENRKREHLLAQLAAVEVEGVSVMQHANKLKNSIKKLQKDRRFVSVHASQVAESKDVFLESLSQFEASNRVLSKLVKAQQAHQSSMGYLTEHKDLLEQKLCMSQSANEVLRGKLEEQEQLQMHTNSLHDEIGQRDGEIQTLAIRLQALEEQLSAKEMECSRLQTDYSMLKQQYHHDKDVLKKASRQHKDRALQSERTLDSMGGQLEEANVEFSKLKSKLAKSTQEILTNETEISSLKMKVHELEACLSQSRITSKLSLDTISSQLTDKSQELYSSRAELERLKGLIATLESQNCSAATGNLAKITSLESEVSQLDSSMSHYQGLATEYKGQLERNRLEREELDKTLRLREQEIDQLKREMQLEAEKHRLKFQQQLSELEPMPEMLKTSEQRLADAQERLLTHEHRNGEQNRLITDLTVKAEQTAAMVDSLKEKLHEATAERRAVEGRLVSTEHSKQELEQQNRELLGISARKEELVRRLQERVEQLVQEITALTAQAESAKNDGRRQAEHVKERASSKERASASRISDLESQLARANSLATQFRKSKDDLERRYHARVHELQDRLEQATSTKRSLENYITFLKSSYASVFSDNPHHVPGSPISPLTH